MAVAKNTAFLYYDLIIMSKASELVSCAVVGKDFTTVVVGNKSYVIIPPTIHKIAGCGHYLSGLDGMETLKDVLLAMKDMKLVTKALSWLIQGDDDLCDELSSGTLEEVVDALDKGLSMISAENFCKLSVLAKNVATLTAKQR